MIAFDFETHLIGGGCSCGVHHGQFPPPVCLSWAKDDGTSGLVSAGEGIAMLEDWLDAEETFIGAETAFDVLVSVEHHRDPDRMIAKWVQAYSAGRVRDVLIRKRLLDLAVGRFKFHTFSDGNTIKVTHDLAAAAWDTLGVRLAKGEDTWRLRYAELEHVPLERWPQEARDYALLDAEISGQIFEAQQDWKNHKLYSPIVSLWYGTRIMPDGSQPDPFADEHAQTCHALWIKAMSGHGICIDAEALQQFEGRNAQEFLDLCSVNRRHGLLSRVYWRDLKRMRAEKVPYANNAAWRELVAHLDVDDPEALAAWEEMRELGLVSWRHKRNTKIAQQKMAEIHALNGTPVPRTESYDATKHGEYDCVALDADACRIAANIEKERDVPVEERKMQAYADFVHVSHVLNTDIPKFRQGIDRPLHSHFTSMVETGRTSSAGPPIQNIARGEKERAGQRECFVPTRPRYVFIDIDYAQLELFCLAQVCKWLLGYSTMGDAILRGEDLHTSFAAKIISAKEGRRITYEELRARDAKTYEKERGAAKAANFGRPGGLGSNTMVAYAAKAYGVYLPADAAPPALGWKQLLEIWDEQWPEMPDYFAWVNSRETHKGSGVFCLPQAWSGRLRGGATYTAACNSSYQGLGADLAKLAGWYLFRASYVQGVDPALCGAGYFSASAARTGHFIHDQFLVEVPEERAEECLPRVEHWCRLAAREVLPDYGEMLAKKTSGLIARRWSKQAERIEDKVTKRVQIWEDDRL